MNSFRGHTGKSLKAVIPLLALSMFLGGCTPLEQDAKDPAPAGSPSAMTTPTPTAEAETWENCKDPVVTAGEEKAAGWKFVSARLKTVGTGSEETQDLLFEPFLPSISWNAGGPTSNRFEEQVSEATGKSLNEATDGIKQMDELLGQMNDKGVYVAYKTIEKAVIPLSISCGSTLASKGTLNASYVAGTGILDCSLSWDKDKDKSQVSPSEAKEKFCPQR